VVDFLTNPPLSPFVKGGSKELNLMAVKLSLGTREKGHFIADELNLLKEITKIKSTTDLIKSIVLRINDDILVKKEPNIIKKLKSILAATA
jgi:hypothetical protein